MDHERYMRLALELAARGEGLTRPNPPVGAVVVAGNSVVGRGWHRAAGMEHAEPAAIREAGGKCPGATLYVTLEPCSTHGRTPPCVDAVIRAGIKKVVVSARDPNPKHSGRGLRILKRAGIKVVEGVCAEQGRELIAPFAKWITAGRPYVTLKLGMTVDGCIADFKGGSRWITSEKSRDIVQALRRKADVICVGAGTARADNPSLLPRPALGRRPFRLVLDPGGALPLKSKLLNDGFQDRTIIVVNKRCSAGQAQILSGTGAQIWRTGSAGEKISVKTVLGLLGREGLLHAFFEGGGKIAESLVCAGLVDEFIFFVAPAIMGGNNPKRAFSGRDIPLKSAPRLVFKDVERVGPDIMIRAVPAE